MVEQNRATRKSQGKKTKKECLLICERGTIHNSLSATRAIDHMSFEVTTLESSVIPRMVSSIMPPSVDLPIRKARTSCRRMYVHLTNFVRGCRRSELLY